MSKRGRLLIIIAVLAACFYFLWPSISWYARTPKETQQLALSSLERIKDYSVAKAGEDAKVLTLQAQEDHTKLLTSDQKWIAKAAKKNYKAMEEKCPSPLTLYDALKSFSTKDEFENLLEDHYRAKILKAKKYYKNSVKLGLDLNGGMSVIVKADLDEVLSKVDLSVMDADTAKKSAMANAIENLTSRIDTFGLSEPVIRQQGEDRIYIELPGSAETDQINSIIMGRGVLNFRMVDEDATAAFLQYYFQHRDSTFDAKGNLVKADIIPQDCEVFGNYFKDAYGLDQRYESEPYIVVKKEVALEGKYIKSAQVGQDATHKVSVNFTLDTEGAAIFGTLTKDNVGKRMAIINDHKVRSSPVIQGAIPNGQVSISGAFNTEEAMNLQKVLQSGSLDVPLSVESQQVVGASLGASAIKNGVLSIALGLALILIFMLVYYKGAGVNACVAQVLNLYIMFSILSALNLTITLPSVAGMILTIGMAVDANIIIFERIKEELRLGKDRASAIQSGFDNALWAILDSNITTFIAALAMSLLGNGSIQGFAVSLAIGVISTVFTALVVSRLMFDFNTEVVHKKYMSIGWGVK